MADGATSMYGVLKATRKSIRTLRRDEWMNNEIINFAGQALAQPNQERDATRVQVYNSFLVKKLLSGQTTANGYTFDQVETWSGGIKGGVAAQKELYIPVNADQNYWNFTWMKMRERVTELWDLLGVQNSNNKFLRAAEPFVKDIMLREVTEGR